jgi:hypothetical protein
LTAHARDAFFLDVLRFLDRVDPEPPGGTPQIVDTFAFTSPVTPASGPAALLRHLTLRLARLWLAYAPAALQHALPPLDISALVHPGHARSDLARLWSQCCAPEANPKGHRSVFISDNHAYLRAGWRSTRPHKGRRC